MGHGIKIGTNVKTQSNKELQYTSDLKTLKFYKWGNAQFTTDGSGNATVSIAHGLSYSPIAMVFRKITPTWSSGGVTIPDGSANSFCNISSVNFYAGGLLNSHITAYADTTYLVIVGSSLTPSTTYYFRYYILVDLSESFTGAVTPSGLNSYGWKVSPSDVDVRTAKEYQLISSSNYKSVQFHANHIVETTLELPAMWASRGDGFVDEAVYADFNHNLGYAPFFLAYYSSDSQTTYTTIPRHLIFSGYPTFSVNGFCDSSKVRIYFWRGSTYDAGDIFDYWSNTSTIYVKIIMFTENLLGAESA